MRNNDKAVAERQSQLLRFVLEEEECSVKELARKLGVSDMTIRRDLSLLEERGRLVRMHGKAVAPNFAKKTRQESRSVLRCRDMISAYAASLVGEGETLFINGSRTALNLLKYLEGKNVRVVTNNGWILGMKYPRDVRVRLLGGDLYDHVLVGEYVVESLLGLKADRLFIGCAAVYADGAFRYDIPTEIGINEMMISRTRGSIYVLADHTKLQKKQERTAVYGSCRYSIPVTLVTDSLADEEVLQGIREAGIRVVIVPVEETEKEMLSAGGRSGKGRRRQTEDGRA